MTQQLTRAALAAVAVLSLCLPAAAASRPKPQAAARLVGQDGKQAGTVHLQQTSHGVLIDLEMHGLPPGAHAVHVLAVGRCDPKTKFASAGSHFNPTPKMHGYLGKGGPHAGDLPNQYAGADGGLHAVVLASAISLGKGKKTIFDKDGTSIAVDARGDDYFSQPSGNSGEHLACGVIQRTR